MNKIIIFSVLIPSIFIIIFSFIFLFWYRFYKKQNRLKIVENLKKELRLYRLEQINLDINKIYNVSQKNEKYQTLFNRVDNLYNEISSIIDRASIYFSEFDHNKFIWKTKIFKTNYLNIHKIILQLNKLEENFNLLINQINNQDEFIKSEFIFYQSIFRKVLKVYERKNQIMFEINLDVKNLINKIGIVHGNIEELLSKAEINEAIKELSIYSKHVNYFVEIVNEAPNIFIYISKTIPLAIEKLKSLFSKNEFQILSLMNKEDFDFLVKKITSLFEEIISQYKKLNLEITKKSIKELLIKIKETEKIIDFEIHSNFIFNKYFDECLVQIYALKNEFENINNFIKHQINLGKSFSNEIIIFSKSIEEKIYFILDESNFLLTNRNNNLISFSEKILKLKKIMKDVKSLNENIFNINNQIQISDTEIIKIKNKFYKLEILINDIFSNITLFNLKLSNEELKQKDHVLKLFYNIAGNLSNSFFDFQIKNEIKNLEFAVINFYKNIEIKLFIAKTSFNLIREFSYLRAVDNKIDANFLIAENDFLIGNYEKSFDLILNTLEERRK